MRIVAISDQHGHFPDVPPCDLLILAGDICPDRIGTRHAMRAPRQQQAWFNETARPWLVSRPAAHRIATWGNHDWCGQACDFSEDAPSRAPTTRLQIVVDELTHVRLSGGTTVSVWATPWSNQFMNWAFMKSPPELGELYASIPAGIDILVSHQPPYGYGDFLLESDGTNGPHLGSHELRATIDRVKPRLVICGHFHEGRGRYDHDGIPIYNVSVVNDYYQLVHPATVIDFD
jgi:Icc-related predicted phosphoesterase